MYVQSSSENASHSSRLLQGVLASCNSVLCFGSLLRRCLSLVLIKLLLEFAQRILDFLFERREHSLGLLKRLFVLSQDVFRVLVIRALTSLKLSNARTLLFELLVVAGLLLHKAIEG